MPKLTFAIQPLRAPSGPAPGETFHPTSIAELDGAWPFVGSSRLRRKGRIVPVHVLEVFVLREGAWTVAAREDDVGNASEHEAVARAGDELLGVAYDGGVFRLAGKRWQQVGAGPEDYALGKPLACWDPGQARLVVYGGTDLDGKASNDTWFFDRSRAAWSRAAKPTHRPKGLKGSLESMSLFFDTALGSVVRIEEAHVSVLGGDRWATSPLARPVHGPVFHDPRTGETLGLDLWEQLVRFHPEQGHAPLGRCSRGLAPDDDVRLGFEPATRLLHVFPNDWSAHSVVDLGPAFDAAAAMGPRWRPEGAGPVASMKAKPASRPRPPARDLPALPEELDELCLYSFDGMRCERWICKVEGQRYRRWWGSVDAKILREKELTSANAQALAAEEAREKLRQGYVRAQDLTEDQLLSLVGWRSWALGFRGKGPELGWLGGAPAGITGPRWPRAANGAPLTFLAQVSVEGLLEKHAAVAVFCALGEAPSPRSAEAVLLTAAEVGRGDAVAPKGVVPLPRRALRADPEPRWEVSPELLAWRSEWDPPLEALGERLARSGSPKLQRATMKRGGPAVTRAGAALEVGDGLDLLLQLDLHLPELAGLRAQLSPADRLFVFGADGKGRTCCLWDPPTEQERRG